MLSQGKGRNREIEGKAKNRFKSIADGHDFKSCLFFIKTELVNHEPITGIRSAL